MSCQRKTMEWNPKFKRPLSPRRPRSPSSVSSSSDFSSRPPSFSSDGGDSFVSAEDCFEEDKRESSISCIEEITGGYGGRSAVQFMILIIKVRLNSDKSRVKAMKLVVAAKGANSVAIRGEDRDHFRVTGDNIDCVMLTRTLRKKFGYAELVSVSKVKRSGAVPPVPQNAESDNIRQSLASQERQGGTHSVSAETLERGIPHANNSASNFKRLQPPYFYGTEDEITSDTCLQGTETILEATRVPASEEVGLTLSNSLG